MTRARSGIRSWTRPRDIPRVATGRIATIDSPLKQLGSKHRRLRKKRRSPKAA